MSYSLAASQCNAIIFSKFKIEINFSIMKIKNKNISLFFIRNCHNDSILVQRPEIHFHCSISRAEIEFPHCMLDEAVSIETNSFSTIRIEIGFVSRNCVKYTAMRVCWIPEIVAIVVNNKIIDSTAEVIKR